jgi:kinesin family member 13
MKLEAERAKKELERELKKKELQSEETLKRFKQKERHYLEQKLSKYLPKVMEINMIAKELKRNVHFAPKLSYNYVDPNELQRSQEKTKKSKITIQVKK